MKRALLFLTLTALLFGAIVSVAGAGGWAVITLDAVAQEVVVNQPVQVGMTIRQHGKTPWVYDNVRVRGFHSTGETFETRAKMDERGHYTATLNFSRAGKWQWAIASGLAPEWQTMPEIEVANSAPDEILLAQTIAARNTTPTWQGAISPTLLLAFGIIGLVGSAGGLMYWFRARK